MSDTTTLPRPGPTLRFAALLLLPLAAVAFLLVLRSEPERAWGNLLLSSFYFLILALGAVFFLSAHYLVRAGWCAVLQRVPEALAVNLTWLALLLGLTFLGRHELYHWSHAEAVAHDPVLGAKSPFLNTPFFYARMAVVLLIWNLLAWQLRRLSLRQEGTPQFDPLRRLIRYSAIFIVVFALSFSVASFDWLMSLEPHWFSTIFAVYWFAGLFLAAIATIIVVVMLLDRAGAWGGLLGAEHVHDLGKLLFAFSCFWAYTWLSQYLLIWYANLPEETSHYLARAEGEWRTLFYLNPILNWVLPFLLLLSRAAKRRPALLVSVALIVLVGRWLDLYLQVMPALGLSPAVGVAEVLIFAACGAAFAYGTRLALARAPLIPRWNPYLRESLSYKS